MHTPQDKAGEITERIMRMFSEFQDDAIAPLETERYNRVYERTYNILKDYHV